MVSLRLVVTAIAAAGAHAFVPVAPNFRVQRPASRGAVAVTMLTDAEQAYLKAKAAAEAKRKAAEAALAAAEAAGAKPSKPKPAPPPPPPPPPAGPS